LLIPFVYSVNRWDEGPFKTLCDINERRRKGTGRQKWFVIEQSNAVEMTYEYFICTTTDLTITTNNEMRNSILATKGLLNTHAHTHTHTHELCYFLSVPTDLPEENRSVLLMYFGYTGNARVNETERKYHGLSPAEAAALRGQLVIINYGSELTPG
jgi:hypothetical protein